MNYVFETNLAPSSMSAAVEALVNKARDAGWSVQAWSNGSTVSTTDQDLSAGTLNGMDRWVVIQQPAGGSAPFAGSRQFCFWRRSTDREWCINYSRNGSWTGGGTGFVAGTASTPPSGTSSSTPAFNEKSLLQSSNGQERTAVTLFPSSNGPADRNYIFQIGFDQDSPFGWYLVAYPQASGSSLINLTLGFEGMASGSFAYDAGNVTAFTTDLDPYLLASSYNPYSVSNSNPIDSNSYGQKKIFKGAGQAGETFVSATTAGNASRPNSFVNHVTGKVDLIPVPLGDSSSFKGFTHSWRWSCQTNNNLIVFDGSQDRINVGNVAMPWDITVTPTP